MQRYIDAHAAMQQTLHRLDATMQHCSNAATTIDDQALLKIRLHLSPPAYLVH
jgi:hypothetical protein